MSKAYYNEFDPFAAAWLRELIKAGQSVGKLRGYGNSITAEVAKGFIDAYLETERI